MSDKDIWWSVSSMTMSVFMFINGMCDNKYVGIINTRLPEYLKLSYV